MKKQPTPKKLILQRESIREIGALLDQVRAGAVSASGPVLKRHNVNSQTHATGPGGC